MLPAGFHLAGSQKSLNTKESMTKGKLEERAILSDCGKNITFANFTKT